MLLGSLSAAALFLGGAQASASTVRVQTGNTVWSLAQQHHVSVNAIVSANQLANANRIYVNQKLTIPDGQTASAATTSGVTAHHSANATTSTGTTTSSTKTTTASASTGGGIATALKIANSNVPYVYGGTSMSGFDCSGLVQYALGLSARTTYQQTKLGTHHYDVANAPAGAILFWGSDSAPYHDAISLGNGKYVAAQNETDGIGVFNQSNWQPSYYIVL
ncbi:NlpC/P60 family protein [Levilactobacillus zymae]|nr:NlpC/P60 family protein [Levilactobacillus zymae]MDT6980169.1 NlpC/P60 family protein [Levilactobacillus zymae]